MKIYRFATPLVLRWYSYFRGMARPPRRIHPRCRATARPLEVVRGVQRGTYDRVPRAASLPAHGAATRGASTTMKVSALRSKWRRPRVLPEEWLISQRHTAIRRAVYIHERRGGRGAGGRRARGWMDAAEQDRAASRHTGGQRGWKRGSAVLRRTPALWRRDDPRGRGESGRSLLGARAFPPHGTRHNRTAYVRGDGASARSRPFVRTTAPP